MEYFVEFNFNLVNKRGLISGKSGEISITSKAKLEDLKTNKSFINLIIAHVKQKTNQKVFSVEITNINKK